MKYIIILLILIILFLIYIKYENTNLEITNYKIKSKKIPEKFSGITFVVIADLHNNTFGINNKKLFQAINKIKPSFIIIAGDMIVGNRNEDFVVATSFLENLSSQYPIYYGLGNHEQRIMVQGRHYNDKWDQYINKLEELDVKLLDNHTLKLTKDDETISISGLTIDLSFFGRINIPQFKDGYIEKLIGKLDKECYNIVIAHNPIYFEEYIKNNFDLMLSGHMHGGIVRLPFIGGLISPQLKLFPKYDGGCFKKGEQVMLVSRGLGTHTIPVRVFNRPELMTVTLEREQLQ